MGQTILDTNTESVDKTAKAKAEAEQTDLQIALEHVDTHEVMAMFCQAMDVVDAHPRPGDTPTEGIGRAIDLSKWAVLGIGLGRAEKAKASRKER